MNQIYQRLNKICEIQPNQTALVIRDQSYTYRELQQFGQIWGTAILQNLKHEPQYIGFLSDKSFVAYASVWTSLFCGSPFIPIHKTTPLDRMANILNQVQLDVLIVDATCIEKITELLPLLRNKPLLLTPENNKYDIHLNHNLKILDNNYLENCIPKLEILEKSLQESTQSLAYTLFTSGSTGKPKGVPITKKNLLSYLDGIQKVLNIKSTDRLSQTFELTFDLSIFDMFMTWIHGASLYVFRAEDLVSPADLINKYKLTVWFSVPSVVMLMMQSCRKNSSFPTLRLSLFCGEALSVKVVKFWKQLAFQSKILNLYGPTEMTISCTHFECSNEFLKTEPIESIVPIGKVIEDHLFKIIDSNGKKLKLGEIGELCIHGSQMFPGYLDSSLNKSAFTEISEETGERNKYYKTGDLVYLNKNFDLIYKGRKDRQIKLRGYRIELSEIEQHLRSYPGVITAIVRLESLNDSQFQKMSAYVFGENLNTDQIHNFLMKRIPSYMVPNQIILMNELTTSTHGKVHLKIPSNYFNQKNLETGAVCKV